MDEAKFKKIRKLFGERIRALRKAKGFSQEEFAHECDLHRTYMGDVERGERNISLDNIVRISAALGITISDFFIEIK